MHFLRNNETYENAIFKTLMKGGDTDTNAAIVGALIGTLHGANSIPEYMRTPVLSFNVDDPKLDDNNHGYTRPKMYSASNALALTKYLFTHKYTR